MLAYIAWHRTAAGVDAGAYEQALQSFHHSLARVPPSGFEGSHAFRAGAAPPQIGSAEAAGGDEATSVAPHGARPGYEDWYLLDGWSALGVLEEAAVAHGHVSRHDAVAGLAAHASGAVYRLSEGHPGLVETRVSVWVAPARNHAPPAIADLLGDGMDPRSSSLWRRSLGLGPAPQYCLLAREPPPGAAPARLPPGWRSVVSPREPVW